MNAEEIKKKFNDWRGEKAAGEKEYLGVTLFVLNLVNSYKNDYKSLKAELEKPNLVYKEVYLYQNKNWGKINTVFWGERNFGVMTYGQYLFQERTALYTEQDPKKNQIEEISIKLKEIYEIPVPGGGWKISQYEDVLKIEFTKLNTLFDKLIDALEPQNPDYLIAKDLFIILTIMKRCATELKVDKDNVLKKLIQKTEKLLENCDDNNIPIEDVETYYPTELAAVPSSTDPEASISATTLPSTRKDGETNPDEYQHDSDDGTSSTADNESSLETEDDGDKYVDAENTLPPDEAQIFAQTLLDEAHLQKDTVGTLIAEDLLDACNKRKQFEEALNTIRTVTEQNRNSSEVLDVLRGQLTATKKKLAEKENELVAATQTLQRLMETKSTILNKINQLQPEVKRFITEYNTAWAKFCRVLVAIFSLGCFTSERTSQIRDAQRIYMVLNVLKVQQGIDITKTDASSENTADKKSKSEPKDTNRNAFFGKLSTDYNKIQEENKNLLNLISKNPS